MICPLCGSSLELKQINFTVAIYICIDLKCPYPTGGQCLEVHRKLEDIKIPSQANTTHNNNYIESPIENKAGQLPDTAQEHKDFDLNVLIEDTLENLNTYMNLNGTPMHNNSGQQDGEITNNHINIENFQSVNNTNNNEHLDELESIFDALR